MLFFIIAIDIIKFPIAKNSRKNGVTVFTIVVRYQLKARSICGKFRDTFVHISSYL